jgi:hypothetical protein
MNKPTQLALAIFLPSALVALGVLIALDDRTDFDEYTRLVSGDTRIEVSGTDFGLLVADRPVASGVVQLQPATLRFKIAQSNDDTYPVGATIECSYQALGDVMTCASPSIGMLPMLWTPTQE